MMHSLLYLVLKKKKTEKLAKLAKIVCRRAI